MSYGSILYATVDTTSTEIKLETVYSSREVFDTTLSVNMIPGGSVKSIHTTDSIPTDSITDKKKEKLMLGEASINPGNGIIFNMTPSPGATSCLGNAERDMREIVKHLDLEFDEVSFLEDLTE